MELTETGTSFCAREYEKARKMMKKYQKDIGAKFKGLLLAKSGTI